MADFYYYLNRQGIRGLQGVKGDQGDSPIITVQTETPNEYILKITNPDGTELISPNLRGNKININEGTYVRYNTETGELYTSTADGATGELAGVVRLATDADITNMDERTAVTPSQLADALSKYLVSPDGSVKIVQNAENSLTELTAKGGSSGNLPIASANTLGGVKIGKNLSITEDGTLSANGGSGGTTDYTQLENKPQINSVELTGNKTLHDLGIQAKGDYLTALPDNAVTTDTDQTISGAKTFTQGITATNIYPSGTINFSGTSGAINSCKQIAGGYGASSYIDLSDMMDIIGRTSLTLKGGTGGLKLTAASSSRITCENTLIAPEIRTTTNKKYLTEEDVDNSTIQIVDDRLHANFDEINGEISNVSSRVTSLEGQVGGISTTVDSNTIDIEDLNKTKNDNIFDIGKFTVVGNPTITDDGIASRFSADNYLTKKLTFTPNSSLKYTSKFTTSSDINTNQYVLRFYNNLTGEYETNACGIFQGNIRVLVKNNVKLTYPCNANTTYYVEMTFTTSKSEAKIYSEKKELLTTLTYTTSPILMKGNNSLLTIGMLTNDGINISNPFTGSIDLKQLSITVDGKEVFNGLMSSTKPIYDRISTLNTNASDFELETSNNFSAVNSALNEKANLSDLSKCASLADFNRLSATVTTLEGQVGDISAVLDNINGEVV